jgi:CRISPR-associated endonuclease/helicase Cas3
MVSLGHFANINVPFRGGGLKEMSVSMVNNFNPTKFQACVQQKVKDGKSILLIAPTGLGKTFAVVGDIQESFQKIVYAVPLRALGGDIREAISKLKRDNKPITAVVHHGDLQESMLFSEEVVVTTYDQVVCGVPGLPLSLPLKAGHAVAGAILMSRLILDEVHLAWGISEQALSILLAIVDFRKKLGLQTVILTATLPKEIAKLVCQRLGLDLVIVGEGDTVGDEGLKLRETNRQVKTSLLKLETKGKGEGKELDYAPLDNKLRDLNDKRIYFANTVERIQATYDRLTGAGMDPQKITVLHNRMPRSWRTEAEAQVRRLFGKDSTSGDWLLLTNQVAEAGLDISAPVVISDPAPVDTLVQRAGRCARWFRKGNTKGQFFVVKVSSAQLKEWAQPYRERYVGATIKTLPEGQELTWNVEQAWTNAAWGLQLDQQSKLPKNPVEKQKEQVEEALNKTTFALNLFDRAAQQHKPGEIASVFREIMSVEIAVYDDQFPDKKIQEMLDNGQRPETSSVSLSRAWSLLRKAKGKARVIRYEEGETEVKAADYIQTGDIVVVPSAIAYLHRTKGLCFGDSAKDNGGILNSEWVPQSKKEQTYPQESGSHQTLLEHTRGVMQKTYERLESDGVYRRALVKLIQTLEPEMDSRQMVAAIAQISTLAAGLHDIGKADQKWQARAREIDPSCPPGLIGRTAKRASHIGFPHTPPGYLACIRACELIGLPPSANHLISAIALASVRHHSSLLNPATVDHKYDPSPMAIEFLRAVLQETGVPETGANQILDAGKKKLSPSSVPLLLPNDDLFPIYALVGRAILMADREDAAGRELEQWRMTS